MLEFFILSLTIPHLLKSISLASLSLLPRLLLLNSYHLLGWGDKSIGGAADSGEDSCHDSAILANVEQNREDQVMKKLEEVVEESNCKFCNQAL